MNVLMLSISDHFVTGFGFFARFFFLARNSDLILLILVRSAAPLCMYIVHPTSATCAHTHAYVRHHSSGHLTVLYDGFTALHSLSKLPEMARQ